MSAAHTPGPWTVSTTFGSVGAIQHESGFVAFPCSPRSVSEDRLDGESWLDMRIRTEPKREAIISEQEANARLIAASPELLAAARQALAECADLMATPAGDALEAAIAKATGSLQ